MISDASWKRQRVMLPGKSARSQAKTLIGSTA